MRIWVRASLKATLLCCLFAGLSVPEAIAASTVINYAYQGTVTSVTSQMTTDTGVVTTDGITGTFTYDSSLIGSSGLYTFSQSTTKAHNFTLKIFNGSVAAGIQQFADQFTGNNGTVASFYAIKLTYNGTAGTTMDIMGDTTYKAGYLFTHSNNIVAYDLQLVNPNNAGGYTATNLPLPNATLIRNFVMTTAKLTWDPAGDAFGADITQFTDLTVPEPSSVVMGTLALLMGVVAVLIGRRRAAGVNRTRRHAAVPQAC